ncbi:mitochondrial distribution and morphology protein family 31/32 [Paraphysoderma sedebokerense]|nr:mitochondrial distribution and morphology protein family 31/32 [Paraphysoderma sedebokerense]
MLCKPNNIVSNQQNIRRLSPCCFPRSSLTHYHRPFRQSTSNSFSSSSILLHPKQPTFGFPIRWSRRTQNRFYSTTSPPTPSSPPKPIPLPPNATFFQRLRHKIRFALTRGIRPWTIDDFLAMFSWVFVGNSLFILAGTTTFVSLVLWIANSLQFQELVAYSIGRYLTASTGATVIFESAIMPNWREGKISLKNVTISRTLASDESQLAPHYYYDAFPKVLNEGNRNDHASTGEKEAEDDGNFTKYELKVQSIDVTLSLVRWLDGKGLIKDAVVRGVRGVVDRRHVTWPEDWQPIRRTHQPGDFELDHFAVEDFYITILNPEFRPFTLSIFNAELPVFRKQWLLYDIICADSIVGMYENCLFSVHTPQSKELSPQQERGKAKRTKRMTRLKIDGVPIDHLNAGTHGPFGWIKQGTVDITALIRIPTEPAPDVLEQIIHEIEGIKDSALGKIDEVVSNYHDQIVMIKRRGSEETVQRKWDKWRNKLLGKRDEFSDDVMEKELVDREKRKIEEVIRREIDVIAEPPTLDVELDVRLNGLKAYVPFQADEISYLTNAFIRPVVSYMNHHRTCIPVKSKIKIPLSNFDGAWTIYESHLVDVLSSEVGHAIVTSFFSERERARRLKKVGLWSVQTVTKNLIDIWSYVKGFKNFAYFVENWGVGDEVEAWKYGVVGAMG